MKFQRQSLILELIDKEEIETQEQLSARLCELGMNVTQATVSRDIKELHLIKTANRDGKYRYSTSGPNSGSDSELRFRTIFREGVVNVDFAGNIVVIKTLTGVANAACAAIDAMKLSDIVGSIAGDDTLFLVMRSPERAASFSGEIQRLTR